MSKYRVPVLLGLGLAFALCTACIGGKATDVLTVYTGGDAHRGKQLIDHYRCGACHYIPGVQNANGMVGPPLLWFARRTYIGGELPNTPDNLVRWIMSPKSVEPGTAMPALGVSEQQARDIAAYLYTLR